MPELKKIFNTLPQSLVTVSNRGPVVLSDSDEGVKMHRSVGGLVSAVEPIISQTGGVWIAWGGRADTGREDGKVLPLLPLPFGHPKYYFSEILLTPWEISNFYDGFTNSCLWPLCHSFIGKTVFDPKHWQSYIQVNQKFASATMKVIAPGQLIWIHDYHLALVPQMLKKQLPSSQVSLFWHIPFPAADIFQALPWSAAILRGMLGSEFIAFHTAHYVFNFLLTVERVLNARVDLEKGVVYWEGREIKVQAVPIGIDWKEFDGLARQESVRRRAEVIRRSAGGERLLLGVDRLDYTKGILERLRALEALFEHHPEWRGRLTFIQVAVPSRTNVPGYRQLKREIDETVGRLNGRFTEDYHVPVKYIYRSLTREELVAHYLAADMALVTPLRDGLNLVAKEFVISQVESDGVLLLSPLAGVSSQMKEALVANPYHPLEVADKIVAGLDMPAEEKKKRLAALQSRTRREDIHWWWDKIRSIWIGTHLKEQYLAAGENAPDSARDNVRTLNLA
ncbi:MAG: trehalose-6-phosphate synthase [Firmicutes bacterium]|nr:trehalose-6-phosphate synthase [Bacillota bacterium]